MICEIISVGTEVVMGDIIDTNAPYLSKELVSLGIDTMYRTSVKDDDKTISEVLNIAKKRADLIAELLPNSTIVYGDGTKHDLLLEEGIEAMDAFIPLTGIDEENIIAAMYANKQKVKKIITKTNREELFYILEEVGIQNNVSPKDIVASNVIRYIRALANSFGSNVITLYRLVNK